MILRQLKSNLGHCISWEDIFVVLKPVDQIYFCGLNFMIKVSYAYSERI